MNAQMNKRYSVWQNLMVFGINELIWRGQITLNGKRGSWDKVTAHCHYSDGMKCIVRAFDVGFGRMNIVVIYGIGIRKPTKMNNCFSPPVWNETKAVVQGTVELDGLSKLDGDILFLSDSVADALAECVVEPSGFFMSDKLYI